jgi:hypothetical protein
MQLVNIMAGDGRTKELVILKTDVMTQQRVIIFVLFIYSWRME